MRHKCIHTDNDRELTAAESKFAEENHGLLLRFMAVYRLDEEYYGNLSVRYLTTVRRYLKNSKLRKQYRFSTILWYNLRSELSHMLRAGAAEPVDIVEVDRIGVADDLSVAEIEAFWKQVEHTLTGRELEVLRLRCEGWKYSEIAEKCGTTFKAVSSRFSRLRPKIKAILE